MTIIKIDRASIKPNPRAGATSSIMQGHPTATFEFPQGGKIPANLLSKVNITEWQDAEKPEDGRCQCGYIINHDDWKLLLQVPGITIKHEKGLQRIYHMPEPEWLYSYENPQIECNECHELIPVNDIETDYEHEGEDEYYHEQCPVCNGRDTFPEFEYESIEDIVGIKKTLK